ncbi:hypothetical protein GCM10011415_28570 [Salipiger pallidus]|uniref:Uncharacterized protein n=1 Tax=Salipiger pallidus TaxID=1775170 RepID=A0A8J2ZL30_9RHOB|nr:hypothetical protein [Salipiger pallidus]GGG77917.1 hypothetical protein GCM10011415_28570 [Salipiger pallidus]
MMPSTALAEAPSATVVSLRNDAPALRSEIAAEDRSLLEHLRVVALGCRVAARTDMFHACAVLAVDKPKAQAAHAQVLMRTLSQALGTRPRMLRPGVAELSFDERWLLALLRAVRMDDIDSLVFLMRSRVPHHAQRNLTFLIRMVSERFSRI